MKQAEKGGGGMNKLGLLLHSTTRCTAVCMQIRRGSEVQLWATEEETRHRNRAHGRWIIVSHSFFFFFCFSFLRNEKWHFSINRARKKKCFFFLRLLFEDDCRRQRWKRKGKRTEHTLQPSQVKAPKWKPAAGSPHTLHSWFICKGDGQKRERDR